MKSLPIPEPDATRSGGGGLGKTLIGLGCGLIGAWYAKKSLFTKPYDLRGKVVLITGGSRGLGLVLARQLAEHRARLVICARDRAELDRAFEELSARNVPVLAITCDVTKKRQVENMVAAVLERWSRIDVLINNAGTICVGPEETMTRGDYELAMRTNFWGPLNMIQAVVAGMRQRQEGRIVNITSIGGKISIPHLLPYNASKFALVGLSEGLRSELVKDGVVVTTVCPGLMTTGSPRHAWFKGQNVAEYAWFSMSDALPGLAMRAEQAAREIIDACRYGRAEVVLSIPAKISVLLHDLFPGLVTDFLALMNRLLPGPGGIGKAAAEGKESQSDLVPSWLQKLNERAARSNNEIGPDEVDSPWTPRNRVFGDRNREAGE